MISLVWTERNVQGLINRLEVRLPGGHAAEGAVSQESEGCGRDDSRWEQHQPSHPRGQWHRGPMLKGQSGDLVMMKVRLGSGLAPIRKKPRG